ncbi:hypothetical protein RDI58_004492 [Solanum bulbocastanum]|uniref:Uncharacterized protein n=1 Tax=Solanum bulbocastanum TaxID=147425 RepID=A0AAN8U5Y0_SOLBU
MSQTKTILAILVLAMILYNIIECIEGRDIKFEDRNYLMKPNVVTIMKSKKESRKLKELTLQKNEYAPASPSPGHVDGHSPGIGH